jgi:transposase
MFIVTLMIFIFVLNVSDFVFVDESGVDKYHHRTKYRSKRGVRLHWEKPGRKFARTNVIAGLHNKKHIAVRCYNHTTNSEFFNDWFEWELLAAVPRKSLIIMDNAAFHKKKQLFEIAAKHGVYLLFLPPYSPDFNPIEISWANLKRWLVDNVRRFFSLDFAIEHYFSAYGY